MPEERPRDLAPPIDPALSRPALNGRVYWAGPYRSTDPGADEMIVCGGAAFMDKPGLRRVGETDVRITDDHRMIAVFGRFTRDILGDADPGGPARIVEARMGTPGFPRELRGDFAIVIWDDRARRLTLIRDHLGTRPLFYIRLPDGVAFASDIASLVRYSRAGGTFHMPYLTTFLAGHTGSEPDRTPVPDIFAVPPATIVEIGRDGVKSRRHWRPEESPRLRYKTDAEYFEHGRELLRRAVNDRIPHGASFATHLSGGLDSTAIASILATHCRASGLPMPHGYCWQPEPEPGGTMTWDQEFFRLCLEQFGMEGSAEVPSIEDWLAVLSVDPMTTVMTSEIVLERPVMRAARQRGASVIFSGFCGDECVSYSGKNGLRTNLPLFLNRLIDPGRFAALPQPRSFMKPEFQKTIKRDRPLWYLSNTRNEQIHRLLRFGLSDRLTCWSIFGAADGIQYVYPLADPRLIEFALGTPQRVYADEGTLRNLMRGMVHGLVPDRVRTNTDKRDPARFAHTIGNLAKIAGIAARQLGAFNLGSTRAEFINLAALKGSLLKLSEGDLDQPGRAMTAIQFLGLTRR